MCPYSSSLDMHSACRDGKQKKIPVCFRQQRAIRASLIMTSAFFLEITQPVIINPSTQKLSASLKIKVTQPHNNRGEELSVVHFGQAILCVKQSIVLSCCLLTLMISQTISIAKAVFLSLAIAILEPAFIMKVKILQMMCIFKIADGTFSDTVALKQINYK